MPARLRFVPLFLVAALGCGLHLHRPRDAASAEGADGELKASRLVDGFTEELAQSQAMLTEEVAAAQAWAEVGRNRDLLDILAAKGESDPEIAVLYFTRCRARFKGDGWTTLCSKISTRLNALTGHAFPLSDAPAPVTGKPKAPVAVAPDPAADLLRELRTLQRHWKGPDSGESRLARAVNEHQLAARALRLGSGDAAGPGCPVLDRPDRAPVLQASVDRQRRLCDERRESLQALRERVVCNGTTCAPSELGALVDQLLVVHDALQQHHDELARRLYAYEVAKQACAAPEPQTGKPRPVPTPPQRRPPATPSPATPDPATPGTLSTEPGTPETPPDRPASVAAAAVPGIMSSGTGFSAHVPTAMFSGAGPSAPARLDLPQGAGPIGQVVLFPAAGLLGQPWSALAPSTDPAAPAGSPSATPGATTSPTPATRTPTTAGTIAPTATPATPSTTSPTTSTATPSTPTPGTLVVAPGSNNACDDVALQERFLELAEVPIPPVLVTHDLRPLAELGRRQQLAEQLAAVDALIEARQLNARRKAAADDDPAAAKALAGAPRFARVVHTTIVGIDRLQKAVDTLELAVLALIRETLRVEHDALVEAIGHGERRLLLARAKLIAQLDEAVLLMEAQASLARLERAGCTALPLMPAYEAGKCRDELTKSLVAYGNAWTIGRANEKRIDALDLGVRHDASIVRSRAAMALRQVYLAAGVTELVKFTKGGMAPEALAQLIVSTVGFGVLAGAVLAK